jgi:hypothetical protein
MLSRIASLTLLSSLALVAVQRDAHACSPPGCSPAMAAPRSGSIPTGAPAVPFVEPNGVGAGTPQFRVLDPVDAEVPTTVTADVWWASGGLLVPTAPLVAGTGYHLAYTESCQFGGTVGPVERPFAVGPTVALPTSAGALHATGRVVGPRSVPTSSGSCTEKIEAVSLEVRVAPSPELLAYATIAGFKVFVDGVETRNVYYGQGKVAPTASS